MKQELKPGDEVRLLSVLNPNLSWSYQEGSTAQQELIRHKNVGEVYTVAVYDDRDNSLRVVDSSTISCRSCWYSAERFEKVDPFVDAVRKANGLL